MGLNFAITSGLFAGFEESIFRLRGERDFFNRIYGGAATGVLIGSYIGVVLFFLLLEHTTFVKEEPGLWFQGLFLALAVVS
jgi:hypothetical protein